MTARAELFVTRRVLVEGLSVLVERRYRYEVNDDERPLDRAALLRAVAGRRGVICQIGDAIDAELLDAAGPALRVVATISAGVDHIDVGAARERGVVVTHTPDALTESTADLTWALLMAAARRLREAERCLRGGGWSGWGLLQFLGVDVHGKALGIVGGGRIGGAVARRAAGFHMTVLCHTRRGGSAHMPPGVRYVGLPELLAESDFVTLHVPLTRETTHLIGAAELARMKPTAVLVNAARGPVVDEAALVRALREGRIAAAGLDVYEHEPHVPAELRAMENVVLLPHIGSASRATRATMVRLAAESVVDVLEGRRPAYAVEE